MTKKKRQATVIDAEPLEIDGIKMDVADETSALSVPEVHEMAAEDFRVIDIAITKQIVTGLRGHFLPELCYNIPRRTPTGKTDWPECAAMPNGYCKYQKEKTKHIHIVGIGYQGAVEALQVMPGFSADVVEPPTTVEEMGEAFWRCKAECRDTRTGSSITRWAMKPVLVTRREGVVPDEFAYLVVQSLAVRNVVLAMVPFALKQAWIKEYKAGAKKFKKPRGRTRKQIAPAKEEKPAPGIPAGRTLSKTAKEQLEASAKQAGGKIEVEPEMLMEFAIDPEAFQSVAQATVLLVSATRNEVKEQELKTRFSAWLDVRAAKQEAKEENEKRNDGDQQQELC